ncbi:MAG: TIGR04438 family Trp-rich protein [Burkholderiaceae bacterium]|jgi:small Trp-rich protein|nr:TIGR04438 family Trp-rich protein [Burkholderiaceae bacterium]
MYMLILGVALLVMKWQALGPVAQWPWWVTLTPFALTVVWWFWADWSGYTQRKAMQRELRETQRRRQRRMEMWGQKPRR